jgi:hypothetical protein
VLRFRSESVWLALCPDQVGGVALRRGQARELGVVSCPPGAAPQRCAPVLEALRAWLAQHDVAGKRVNVIISDSLCRYALIPFSPLALNAREEQALLAARFAELYGEMPDWRLQAERPAYGKARLACALPIAFDAGLQQQLHGAGARAGAVQPFFVACLNRWRPGGARAGLLAVVEPHHMVVASFGRHGWSSLRSVFVATCAQVVADVLFREKLMHDLDPALPEWRYGAPAGRPGSIGMALAGAGQ